MRIGKIRFYCRNCGKFMSRKSVTADEWENRYTCKACGSHVIRTGKVILAMISEYIDVIFKYHEEDDYE